MSVSKVVRVEEVHGTFSQNRNSATALLGAGEKNDRVIKPSQDKGRYISLSGHTRTRNYFSFRYVVHVHK